MKFPIKLPEKATRVIGRAILNGKKVSPEICVVSGLLCGGAAIVMTGVRTWKNKEKLSQDIHDVKANTKKAIETQKEENPDWPVTVEEDRKKALSKASGELAKDIAKTYWIPALLSVSSFGLIVGSHAVLRKRLSATTAAYALLMDSYKKYRSRVVEELGAEKDQEFMHGVKMVDSVDAETGEVTKRPMVDKAKAISPYARWFDEGAFDSSTGQWLYRNYAWRDNPMVNECTIRGAQVTANQLLKAKGFLFLNEVYDMLGLPKSVDGQIVGWDMCGDGDKYIDFGVFPEGGHQLPVNKAFLDGRNPNALLDFNVDGPILGALEKTWGPEQTEKLISRRW